MKYLVFLFVVVGTIGAMAQTAVVSGRIMGSNGKPMTMAHVSVTKFGQQKADTSIKTSEVGGFSVSVTKPGLWILQFTGVNHRMLELPLLVDKNMREELTVQLEPNRIPQRIDSVVLVGKFNNYNQNGGIPMRFKDGTYLVEAPESKEQFPYQIIVFGNGQTDATRHSVNGTQQDSYEYDGGGDYRSITNTVKPTLISFDMGLLPKTKIPATFTFKNPTLQRAAEVFNDMQQYRERYELSMELSMKEHQKNGGIPASFNLQEFNRTTNTTARRDSIENQMRSENNDLVLQYLHLNYLMLPQQEQNKTITEKALRVIPASSALWGADPQLLYVALGAKLSGGKEQYINDIIAQNPDRHVVATTLFNELMQASVTKDMPRAKEMYNKLTKEYDDHPLASTAIMYYRPDRKIMEGNPLPQFSITGLDKKKISNETIKGKYTLIDFWATWCGPCVREMPALHAAYEKFKDKIQVISLSFDQKPADIAPFREKKYAMPWIHAFVEKGFDSDLAKAFEVNGIPKPILVAPDGTILATEMDLRGEKLEQTLKALVQ